MVAQESSEKMSAVNASLLAEESAVRQRYSPAESTDRTVIPSELRREVRLESAYQECLQLEGFEGAFLRNSTSISILLAVLVKQKKKLDYRRFVAH